MSSGVSQCGEWSCCIVWWYSSFTPVPGSRWTHCGWVGVVFCFFGLCADISLHWCHWCSVYGTSDVLVVWSPWLTCFLIIVHVLSCRSCCQAEILAEAEFIHKDDTEKTNRNNVADCSLTVCCHLCPCPPFNFWPQWNASPAQVSKGKTVELNTYTLSKSTQ